MPLSLPSSILTYVAPTPNEYSAWDARALEEHRRLVARRPELFPDHQTFAPVPFVTRLTSWERILLDDDE